jgi:hypothetical protein
MKKALLVLVFPSLALANSPCDYDHRVIGKYTKEIQKVENIRKNVFPFVDSRKCVINMDVWIDGNKHQAEGEFTFTADMTENFGCAQAEQRAKENIIKKVSPEVLTAQTNMDCKQNPVANVPQTAQVIPNNDWKRGLDLEPYHPDTVIQYVPVPQVQYVEVPKYYQVIPQGPRNVVVPVPPPVQYEANPRYLPYYQRQRR